MVGVDAADVSFECVVTASRMLLPAVQTPEARRLPEEAIRWLRTILAKEILQGASPQHLYCLGHWRVSVS